MNGNLSMLSNTRDIVFEKVVLAVEQTVYIGDEGITPTSRLVDDLRLGRFARLKLALYLEETFEVEIPDEAVAHFDTVGDIVRYMSRWSLERLDLLEYNGPIARG
jgi:acyl carrier protein